MCPLSVITTNCLNHQVVGQLIGVLITGEGAEIGTPSAGVIPGFGWVWLWGFPCSNQSTLKSFLTPTVVIMYY